MAKKPTSVVTGGAGFIGHHLVRALIKEGHEVFVIDDLVSGKKKDVDAKAHLNVIDITDLKSLQKAFKSFGKIDYVFHLACRPRVQFSIDHPDQTNDTNITGTLNVLIAARDQKVKRVIFSSSSSVYGNQKTMPLKEAMIANPQSPYGLQKYVGEMYMKMFYSVYGLETVCLRYFNVFGPDQDPKGSYAQALPKFIEQRKIGQPITITGDGKQTRDCTHVSDVVRANILASRSSKVGKGEAMNIGGGKNYSINDMAKLIGGKIQYIPARFEPRNTRADISLAKKLLNWTPKVSLEQGIKELLRISE